jgi:hypothetical protein
MTPYLFDRTANWFAILLAMDQPLGIDIRMLIEDGRRQQVELHETPAHESPTAITSVAARPSQ